MSAPQLVAYQQGVSILNADGLNTFESTCDTFAEMRNFSGTTGMQLFVRGATTQADGGQGVFAWVLVTNPTDDNFSTIVPSGQTSAAWVRIPTSGLAVPTLVVATGSSVTLSSGNYFVVINKAVGSATSVTLPGAPAPGQTFVIKDGKGDASTNNITISGGTNIDNSASYVLTINYESVDVRFDGQQWRIT